MPCPNSAILGEPRSGVHSTRIFGIAAFDTIATILGAILIAYVLKKSFLVTLVVIFILGEILHYIYGTQTAFLTMIGVNACPS
jgi:hypothetical protein